jgi:acyl carrier protein
MQETLAQLNEVFRKVFRRADLVIKPETRAADIAGWDSLTHMHLIAETEKHFNVRFTFDEAGGLTDVGDLVKLVERKRNRPQ